MEFSREFSSVPYQVRKPGRSSSTQGAAAGGDGGSRWVGLLLVFFTSIFTLELEFTVRQGNALGDLPLLKDSEDCEGTQTPCKVPRAVTISLPARRRSM